MHNKFSWLLRGYGWLIRLYPQSYRELFADEMHHVFRQALMDAGTLGWPSILRLCLREARDLPQMLFSEYWQLLEQWFATPLTASTQEPSDLPGLVPPGFTSISDALFFIRGCNPRTRRLFDVAFALLGVIVTAPFLLLLPILIKLDSTGPVFYRQARLGKDGRPYTMYKFRSMHADPPTIQPVDPSSGSDPRVTRIGQLARRYNLDEVPQLFNVLKGEMSIFGPRPQWPEV